MRDPHVEELRYRLEYPTDTAFHDPPPVELRTPSFAAKLDADRLVVRLLEHYPSVETAAAVVEPFLHAWELQDELVGVRTGIQFVYEDATVVDRDPPISNGGHVINLEAGIYAGAGMRAALQVGRRSYPPPPDQFVVDADVETMWLRYRKYVNGAEPLPSVAYFCLSMLELSAGGRTGASRKYSIDSAVLRKVGELSSLRGDRATARKAHRLRAPLLPQEVEWLTAVVRLMVRRAAEMAGGKSVAITTMEELPPL